MAALSLNHETEAVLTAALLDQLKRVCTERDIGFRLLDIPSLDDLDGNIPRKYLARIDDDIVDIRPTLKRRMQTEKVYWTRSHDHWTPGGHDIAARALLKSLLPELKRALRRSDAGRPRDRAAGVVTTRAAR